MSHSGPGNASLSGSSIAMVPGHDVAAFTPGHDATVAASAPIPGARAGAGLCAPRSPPCGPASSAPAPDWLPEMLGSSSTPLLGLSAGRLFVKAWPPAPMTSSSKCAPAASSRERTPWLRWICLAWPRPPGWPAPTGVPSRWLPPPVVSPDGHDHRTWNCGPWQHPSWSTVRTFTVALCRLVVRLVRRHVSSFTFVCRVC